MPALAPRLFAVTEGKTSDECYTPKSLFDQLDIEAIGRVTRVRG